MKNKEYKYKIHEVHHTQKIDSPSGTAITIAQKLEKILSEYGVDGKVGGYRTGPIVTLYEFTPNAGIKASKVIGLSDDIARAMSSISARISSQPGKTSLGIEIPNEKRDGVFFGDLINDNGFFDNHKSLWFENYFSFGSSGQNFF